MSHRFGGWMEGMGRRAPPRATRCLRGVADSDGSALVEFALSVPLLALITMASMAVMQIITAQFGVQAAAREAAAVGANISSSINPFGKAKTEAQEEIDRVFAEYNLDPLAATVTFSNNDPTLPRGSWFQVQITYEVALLDVTIPFISKVMGAETTSVIVDANSVMPVQQYAARWPCPSPHPICQ